MRMPNILSGVAALMLDPTDMSRTMVSLSSTSIGLSGGANEVTSIGSDSALLRALDI